MTIAFHIRELLNRLGYLFLSLALTCLVFFMEIPQLLKLSPFSFLHTSWDEAFISLLSISVLMAILWTVPYMLYQLYSWITPALMEKEYNYLKYLIIWISLLVGIFFLIAPTLFWSLPSFLLSFHSSTLLFTPTLTFLASLVWDFTLSYFLLSICSPIAIYYSISRSTLYFILVLYSVVFQDFWSMILMLLPFTISYELSYFLYIWTSTWLKKKDSLKENHKEKAPLKE